MGVLVRPHKRKVKIKKAGVEKKRIWYVRNGNIVRMMTEEEAQHYIREHPGATVYCHVKKYEL